MTCFMWCYSNHTWKPISMEKIILDHPQNFLKEQEIYKVKTIIKHWEQGWGYQYFIKWKGYPIKEAKWEPESNISKDGNMLEQYKLWHQLWNQPQNQMPHTLWLSKSLISLKSLCIGQKVEFILSPSFIKIWKQISIPLIIVSDPDGSHEEYKQLMNERRKTRKIKGKVLRLQVISHDHQQSLQSLDLFLSLFKTTKKFLWDS